MKIIQLISEPVENGNFITVNERSYAIRLDNLFHNPYGEAFFYYDDYLEFCLDGHDICTKIISDTNNNKYVEKLRGYQKELGLVQLQPFFQQ